MPGSLSHLVRRFFDTLFSRALLSSEIAAIDDWLSTEESAVFYSQSVVDQRHGYHAALSVIAAGVGDTTTIRAALLHDIGKRDARIGILGRSIASLLIGLGWPMTKRMALYRDHGESGSRELAELGCEPLVIEFALHHHRARPLSINAATWHILQAADQPPKAKTMVRP